MLAFNSSLFYTIAHDSSPDINKTIYESGKQINAWDYDKVWMYILKRSPPEKKNISRCLC